MDKERGNILANSQTVQVGDFLVEKDESRIPIVKIDDKGVTIFEEGCIASHFKYSDVTIQTRKGNVFYGKDRLPLI